MEMIVLLAAIMISRIIHERGFRVLSDEEKVRLMDGFSKARSFSLIPLLVLIGGYYVLMTKADLDKGALSMGYLGLLIAFVVIRSIMNYQKMKTLDLPDSYRRMFTISQVVSLIGVAYFFYAILGANIQSTSADATQQSERTSAWGATPGPIGVQPIHHNPNTCLASNAHSRETDLIREVGCLVRKSHDRTEGCDDFPSGVCWTPADRPPWGMPLPPDCYNEKITRDAARATVSTGC